MMPREKVQNSCGERRYLNECPPGTVNASNRQVSGGDFIFILRSQTQYFKEEKY